MTIQIKTLENLVEIKQLKKYFKVGERELNAVDDVSFDIYEGETLDLVGESDCGKSIINQNDFKFISS